MLLWEQGLIELNLRHIDLILEKLINDKYVEFKDTEEIKQAKDDMRIKFDKDKEFETLRNLVQHFLDYKL